MTDIDVDEILKALANPARREILAWLREPEKHFKEQSHPFSDGVCVGRIFERAGLSQSTVSAYLAMLQRARLVTSRRAGQWVFYKRNEEVIDAFKALLGRDL